MTVVFSLHYFIQSTRHFRKVFSSLTHIPIAWKLYSFNMYSWFFNVFMSAGAGSKLIRSEITRGGSVLKDMQPSSYTSRADCLPSKCRSTVALSLSALILISLQTTVAPPPPFSQWHGVKSIPARFACGFEWLPLIKQFAAVLCPSASTRRRQAGSQVTDWLTAANPLPIKRASSCWSFFNNRLAKSASWVKIDTTKFENRGGVRPD